MDVRACSVRVTHAPFFLTAVVMTMKSDVKYSKVPRVLFRSNNKATVNKTTNLQRSTDTCIDWEAFLVRTCTIYSQYLEKPTMYEFHFLFPKYNLQPSPENTCRFSKSDTFLKIMHLKVFIGKYVCVTLKVLRVLFWK